MKKLRTISLTYLLALSFPTEAVIIEATLLINENIKKQVVLWGDSHTSKGTETDKRQLWDVQKALSEKYKNDTTKVCVLVEKPPLKFGADDDPQTILAGLFSAFKKHTHVTCENIENRGVSLACCSILREDKSLCFYDDVNDYNFFDVMTLNLLVNSYHKSIIECKTVIKELGNVHKKLTYWNQRLRSAETNFATTQKLIKQYSPKASIFVLSEQMKADNLSSKNLVNSILKTFCPFLEIMAANKALTKAKQGYDVAICSGAIHTRNIQRLLQNLDWKKQAQKLSTLSVSSPALKAEHINLFAST